MYTNKQDIAKWLRNYGVDNYTVNDDLTVDVNGNVNLERAFMGQSKEEWLEELEDYNNHTDPEAQIDFELCDDGSYEGNGSHHVYEEKTDEVYELPVRFGTVKGSFSIAYNELRTLKGCPHTVEGGFDCDSNDLQSLTGAPRQVGNIFFCKHNPLIEVGDIDTQITQGFFVGPDQIADLLNVKSEEPEKTILDKQTFNQAINSLKEKRLLEQALPKAATPSAAILAITKARAEQGLPPVPPPKYRFNHVRPAPQQIEVPQQAPKRTFKL